MKQYLQTFAMAARPKTLEERIQDEMPAAFKQAQPDEPYNPSNELAYFINRHWATKRAKAKSRVK
jgi:hypothetical protein